jgi:hypothetical protein
VFASDRPPRELSGLEERCARGSRAVSSSRCRRPIARFANASTSRFIKDLGVEPTGEMLSYLAERQVSSVREIIGMANRILASAEVAGVPVTIGFIRAELEPDQTEASRAAAMRSAADPFFLDREKIVWRWPDAACASSRSCDRWPFAAASRKRAFPTCFSSCRWEKRQGCLSVTHRNSFGNIYFNKGRICYASIVNRRDRLGDMLVKTGVITQAQLDAGIAIQDKRRDKRLGELLVEMGLLTLDQLHDSIRVQIEESVFFLFTWNQGTFNFEGDVAPDQQDYTVSINPSRCCSRGAARRRVGTRREEDSVVRHRVRDGPGEVVASDVELNAEQKAVLDLVDGTRDVQGIIDASGLVEFEVGKRFTAWSPRGFIIASAKPRRRSSRGDGRSRRRASQPRHRVL